MADFSGRVGLVTGATRGIGLGIAREIVSGGGSVCVTARKEAELEAVVDELDPDGTGRVIAARGSADDTEHQNAAIGLVMDRFGRLDMLVNNAAVNPHYGPLVEADIGAVRKIMDVNVVAVIGWTQQAWRASMHRTGGTILNVASAGGLRAGSFIGAYNVSKAALIHLTRQLAIELAPRVRVNAIAPAIIKTSFARVLYEGHEDEVAARYPLKRLGTTEDTAKAAAFLLSGDSGWVTGETVTIDGGITITGGV
jgi:NAD(P)-dependent dehydrogenase (short-subunit alcohol dehydrogenase family)